LGAFDGYVAIMDKLEQVASGVVLYWHQGNGDLAKRVGSLNDAVKMARLKAKFVQADGVAGWIGRDAALAKEFRQKVERACIQGWVEREIVAVKGIIRTYRSIPLWKRLLRRFHSSA
jgi:hypothetical protein